jgi:hypothetical protein
MNTSATVAIEQDKKLRQLFELAEDNQLAVQDAIACLTAEREAMAKERIALAKASINSAEVSDTLRRATADAIPAIAAAADKSIHASMERALGLTQDAASRIWSGTATPVVERFSTVAQGVHEIEMRVNRAGYRHAWQWTALTALGMAATVLVAVVGVQQLKSQQAEVQRQQEQLQAQKIAFSEEMARMQASVAFLEKKGGRIRLDKCGPEGRLCFEVAADQGIGRNNFKGPWFNSDNQKSFVIPKGY